jgi:hypothetical protein
VRVEIEPDKITIIQVSADAAPDRAEDDLSAFRRKHGYA